MPCAPSKTPLTPLFGSGGTGWRSISPGSLRKRHWTCCRECLSMVRCLLPLPMLAIRMFLFLQIPRSASLPARPNSTRISSKHRFRIEPSPCSICAVACLLMCCAVFRQCLCAERKLNIVCLLPRTSVEVRAARTSDRRESRSRNSRAGNSRRSGRARPKQRSDHSDSPVHNLCCIFRPTHFEATAPSLLPTVSRWQRLSGRMGMRPRGRLGALVCALLYHLAIIDAQPAFDADTGARRISFARRPRTVHCTHVVCSGSGVHGELQCLDEWSHPRVAAMERAFTEPRRGTLDHHRDARFLCRLDASCVFTTCWLRQEQPTPRWCKPATAG